MHPSMAIIVKAAKTIFNQVLEKYQDDVKDSILNAGRDTVERIITGRRTLEDWKTISGECVDKIKDRIVAESGDFRYVGGKLNFAMSEKRNNKVVISFELYFQDANNEYQKVAADSDLYASNFTHEALDEIKASGGVSFEVE
ncbi:MAG: hypothetical protein LBS35_00355 [Synergistaceae bacterium]|nr:hypothetical protein [Synergistaceae bacterium]